MSTRVFIADEHVIVREGLRRVLATDPSIAVVGEAGNGHEVLNAVRTGGFAFSRWTNCSRPAAGFRMQVIGLPAAPRATHP